MRALPIGTLCLALVLLANPANAASGSATTSTGNVDTWGIGSNIPSTDMCTSGYGKVTYSYPCDLIQVCPADLFIRRVTVTLTNPTPGDLVSLTVVERAALGSDNDFFVVAEDYASYNKPVADVFVMLGGCNRIAEAVVTGVLVNGETPYTIEY